MLGETTSTHFVYSSTAAVYGSPEKVPVEESAPLAPINSYGTTKVMVERVLSENSTANDFRYIALRYFNVAGADPQNRIGEANKDATYLITRALKTAMASSPNSPSSGLITPRPMEPASGTTFM